MAEALPTPPPYPPPHAGEVITMMQMIQHAAINGDLDKLDRLIAMRDRENARLAAQVFSEALSAAQAEMAPVAADSVNTHANNSRYASYAALDRAVRPIFTRHGFGLTFDTEDAPRELEVRIVCDVCHIGGHARRYHLDMPVDGKGARGGDVMTKTHAMGSGITYGKRYLLGMIFNLAIDKDDDGNAAGGYRQQSNRPKTVVPSPQERLRQDMLDQRCKDLAEFERKADGVVPHRPRTGGNADRAMVRRAHREWERPAGPSKPFAASQAGRFTERDPPPHDDIPEFLDRRIAAKELNRQLHPMNDDNPY